MPKVSAKRQITLPITQCRALGIEPGDDVEMFVANGQLTVIKKHRGAAKGMLEHVQASNSMTDEESLLSAIQ